MVFYIKHGCDEKTYIKENINGLIEPANKLKLFLGKKGIVLGLDLNYENCFVLKDNLSQSLYEKTAEIIKKLGLESSVLTEYGSSQERGIEDVAVRLGIDKDKSNPREEFDIHACTIPERNRISYNICFTEKYNSLEEFLEKNKFINENYGKLEEIFKRSLDLPEEFTLYESGGKCGIQGFRIRTPTEDCTNETNHIAVSGNMECGYSFGVRYGIPRNPDKIFATIKESREIFSDFFK